MLVSPEFLKAVRSISVVLLGISRFSNAVQSMNALTPMVLIEAGKSTVARLEQPMNNPPTTSLRLARIVTLARLVQSWKV